LIKYVGNTATIKLDKDHLLKVLIILKISEFPHKIALMLVISHQKYQRINHLF